MFTAIFQAIAAIPGILSYMEKFAIWIASQIDVYKKKKAEEDLKKAVDEAKKSKDTSKMDDLFRGGK